MEPVSRRGSGYRQIDSDLLPGEWNLYSQFDKWYKSKGRSSAKKPSIVPVEITTIFDESFDAISKKRKFDTFISKLGEELRKYKQADSKIESIKL